LVVEQIGVETRFRGAKFIHDVLAGLAGNQRARRGEIPAPRQTDVAAENGIFVPGKRFQARHLPARDRERLRAGMQGRELRIEPRASIVADTAS
jgi:hypothetical protein